MGRKFEINEEELRDLLIARAILDVIRDKSPEYEENNEIYLQECIKDFGCNDIDEVANKLIKEFGYEEI